MTEKDILEKILTKVESLDNRMDSLEQNQKESRAILKAIEERTEVNSAKLDRIENDIAKMEGNITALKLYFCKTGNAFVKKER